MQPKDKQIRQKVMEEHVQVNPINPTLVVERQIELVSAAHARAMQPAKQHFAELMKQLNTKKDE